MSDRKKTVCPVSRGQFTASAKDVPCTLGDSQLVATVKEFSTGSFGWYLTGKVFIPVEVTDASGAKHVVKVPVQVGATLTAIGSKELAQGTALTAAA